jgi:hypothetical protein
MASSPARAASPIGEAGPDNSTPENCMGPDSIRTMCDTIGAVLSEDATRELVSKSEAPLETLEAEGVLAPPEFGDSEKRTEGEIDSIIFVQMVCDSLNS